MMFSETDKIVTPCIQVLLLTGEKLSVSGEK